MQFKAPHPIQSARPCCPHRQPFWKKGRRAKFLQVAGLIGLSCCGESSPYGGGPTPPDPGPPVVEPPLGPIRLADCEATSLIQAIHVANLASGPDVIELKSGCVYRLTEPENWWYGPTGLPPITSDITIRPEPNGTGVSI